MYNRGRGGRGRGTPRGGRGAYPQQPSFPPATRPNNQQPATNQVFMHENYQQQPYPPYQGYPHSGFPSANQQLGTPGNPLQGHPSGSPHNHTLYHQQALQQQQQSPSSYVDHSGYPPQSSNGVGGHAPPQQQPSSSQNQQQPPMNPYGGPAYNPHLNSPYLSSSPGASPPYGMMVNPNSAFSSNNPLFGGLGESPSSSSGSMMNVWGNTPAAGTGSGGSSGGGVGGGVRSHTGPMSPLFTIQQHSSGSQQPTSNPSPITPPVSSTSSHPHAHPGGVHHHHQQQHHHHGITTQQQHSTLSSSTSNMPPPITPGSSSVSLISPTAGLFLSTTGSSIWAAPTTSSGSSNVPVGGGSSSGGGSSYHHSMNANNSGQANNNNNSNMNGGFDAATSSAMNVFNNEDDDFNFDSLSLSSSIIRPPSSSAYSMNMTSSTTPPPGLPSSYGNSGYGQQQQQQQIPTSSQQIPISSQQQQQLQQQQQASASIIAPPNVNRGGYLDGLAIRASKEEVPLSSSPSLYGSTPPGGVNQQGISSINHPNPQQQLAVAGRPAAHPSQHRIIEVVTNHFLINIKKQLVHQYAVEFNPDVERIGLRKKLLAQHKELLGNHYAFDGSILFLQKQFGALDLTSVLLPRSSTNTNNANNNPTAIINNPNAIINNVNATSTNATTTTAANNNTTTTTNNTATNVVTPTATFKIRITYITSVNTEGNGSSPQLFNITLSEILRILRLKPLGRHYFDPSRSIDIPKHHVELWPGYFTTVSSNNQAGTTLVVDVTHKVLRTDTVLDFIFEVANNKKVPNWRQIVKKQLVGQIVLTRYSNRTYRIDDIDWNMTPESTFIKRTTGQEYSYMQYYALMYNKTIKEVKQPLLVHVHHRRGVPDETIYLIPELCSLTGITDAMRADYRVMKDIAEYTRVKPPERGLQIFNFVQTIQENKEASEKLEQMGLQLDSNMLTTQGKVFGAEKIVFGKKSHYIDSTTADWSKECRSSQLFSCVPLKRWLLLYSQRNEREANDLALNLIKVGASMGFPIDPPKIMEYRDDKGAFSALLKERVTEDLQCVVCIVPTDAKERYDHIKQVCCTEIPVPSQCIKARTLSKAKSLLSVCSNIARQISCKIGGELWRIEIPLKRTMIVGIDVYHDTISKGQSVAGFCASMNSSFTKYFSPVSFQKTAQELIEGLKRCMLEALKQFATFNKGLPEMILVYRDGVGDGMLDAVLDNEIPQLRSTFAAFGDQYQPRFAMIIVKKRIHTRLFANAYSGQQSGGNNAAPGTSPTSTSIPTSSGPLHLVNPPPGTLVDAGCVYRDWYDFFLVSQFVSQGTVTPTHYHVVWDSSGLDPEHIQQLTYKLCHLYMNWTGTVRVPAPCQYAHKNAYLVGQSLHKQASSKLLNHLYFL